MDDKIESIQKNLEILRGMKEILSGGRSLNSDANKLCPSASPSENAGHGINISNEQVGALIQILEKRILRPRIAPGLVPGSWGGISTGRSPVEHVNPSRTSLKLVPAGGRTSSGSGITHPSFSEREPRRRGVGVPRRDSEFTYETIDTTCRDSIDELEEGLEAMKKTNFEPATHDVTERVIKRSINKKIKTNCGKRVR